MLALGDRLLFSHYPDNPDTKPALASRSDNQERSQTLKLVCLCSLALRDLVAVSFVPRRLYDERGERPEYKREQYIILGVGVGERQIHALVSPSVK